jgi:1-acyl-sn-glycerol-3-phosphate acyltransferase
MRVSGVSTSAPVFPDDGPRGKRIVRRLRGIPLEILAFVLVTVLLPVLALVALVTDLIRWATSRKPFTAIRLVGFLWWFLLGEMRALVIIAWIWTSNGGPFRGDSQHRRDALYNLRRTWARMHLAGVRVLFGLRFEVEGLENAGPGPVLVMIRHASIVDNLVPDSLIAHGHGLGLRFVIKRELEALPVIDIGGRWVPTNFLRRTSSDPEAELARLLRLTEDLVPTEGILIYPEGTRHTAAKLARAKEKIAETQPDIAALAEGLENLLPPRLGGPLALLDATRGTDVVFCAHVGFDGFETVGDIWRGGLVGRTISVRITRVDAGEIPADRDAQIRWLYAHWQEMDDWIGAHREASGPPDPPAA